MPLVDRLARLKSNLEKMEADCRFEIAAIEDDAAAMLASLKQHAVDNPEPVFAVLRRIMPVLVVKNFALVTRFYDVQDVLSRDDVFAVTYGPKMRVVTDGPDFFLGMPNSPDYERDVSHMRSIIRRSDLPGIVAPFVAETAESIVNAANGQLEVVSQLTRSVPTKLVGAYFGCPPNSEADVAAWASTIFQYLFTDLDNDPAVDVAARTASANTRAWLDEVIAKQKATPGQNDTVLKRSFALQQAGLPGMDDIAIRNNLLGLMTGAIPTTSKCCAQALDELLKRPAMLAAAQQAALADDDAALSQYIFEALRFHPNNPGVFRVAVQDYVVGKGTPHATRIPAGTSVLAATQSAMFDETVVENSMQFQIGRPGYVYMHWGVGLHTCFGQYINQVQIPGILKSLLRRKDLRRADGDSGALKYAGPFPSSLCVAFN
ncbi:MAG: cytochrome P450 [Acidobacteriaceae bacterium]